MVFGICFSLVLFSFSSHFNLDFSPEKLLTDFERLDRTGVVVQKKKTEQNHSNLDFDKTSVSCCVQFLYSAFCAK